MPAKKTDPDKADEQQVAVNASPRVSSRIAGAYFLGGAWYAPDGSLLTAVETQQAHRAADKKAAEDRRRALLGGGNQ